MRLVEPAGKEAWEAQSIAFDPRRDVVSFLEPHQNAIYRFNASTGKLVGELAGFDSLKFRFRNAHDDSARLEPYRLAVFTNGATGSTGANTFGGSF